MEPGNLGEKKQKQNMITPTNNLVMIMNELDYISCNIAREKVKQNVKKFLVEKKGLKQFPI